MESVWGVFFAGLAAISWGINSHILHRGAQSEHPFMAMIYRAIFSFPILFTITTIFLGVEVFLVYFEPYNLTNTLLLVTSILLGDGIFIYSMRKYPVSTILPIATSYPLLTSLILIIFGIESLTFLIIAGTASVVTGIAMVTRFRYNSETNERGVSMEAVLLGIGVAIGWGCSVIFARLVLEVNYTESFGLMTVRTFFLGIFAFIIFFSSSKNRQTFLTKPKEERILSFRIFAISGLFGWVFGATFLFLALELVKTSVATPISASNPVIAVIIGQFMGIDEINFKQFLGILTTTFGVILIVL